MGIIVSNAIPMTKTAIIICFCLSYTVSIAQKDRSINSTPITKVEAIKFKTINEALGLPDAYQVLDYNVIYIDSNNVYVPDKLNIPSIFERTGIGTKIIFTDIHLKKGERQIKLADKAYVIK